MRRVATAITLLVLLLAQAWAGPVARLARQACCCKPPEAAQQALSKARCCDQSDAARPPARALARVEQAEQAPLFLAATSNPLPVAPASSRRPRLSVDRPPGLGVTNGLPYRLRI